MEPFITIRKPATAETDPIKKSRFIGDAFPMVKEEDLSVHLSTVRRREHAARHWCHAFRLGNGASEMSRSSDGGEPSGSAGRPIMNAIVSANVTNVAVIVTRYYGGTKLGVGGLARAYRAAASLAIQEAGCIEIVPQSLLRLSANHADLPLLSSVLRSEGAVTMSSEYGDERAFLEIRVEARGEARLRLALVESFRSEKAVEIEIMKQEGP